LHIVSSTKRSFAALCCYVLFIKLFCHFNNLFRKCGHQNAHLHSITQAEIDTKLPTNIISRKRRKCFNLVWGFGLEQCIYDGTLNWK